MGSPLGSGSWPGIRAGLVATACAWFLLQGTPGLDFVDANDFRTPAARERLEQAVGSVATKVALAFVDFNRSVRIPLVHATDGLNPVFRVSQSWHLYRDGPPKCRRLEIRVDGALVHRSADPDHAWLSPQLRNRRVRPMAESTAGNDDATNVPGLLRFVATHARTDFPGASEVRVDATVSPFPCTSPVVDHGWVAKAPDWNFAAVEVQK